MTNVQTVTKEQYDTEKVHIKHGFSDDVVEFQIAAQIPDRTYEDRDVFFAMDEYGMSMKAEEAIKLGQALIDQGTKALLSNMYQHQHIHHENLLQRFIREGRVEKIIFTVLDEKPANHGDGWKLHTVRAVWNEGMTPEFFEDFGFETIVYWSPFEEEFKEQIGRWDVPVEFENYDREKELADFQRMMEEHEKAQGEPIPLEERVERLSEHLGVPVAIEAEVVEVDEQKESTEDKELITVPENQ